MAAIAANTLYLGALTLEIYGRWAEDWRQTPTRLEFPMPLSSLLCLGEEQLQEDAGRASGETLGDPRRRVRRLVLRGDPDQGAGTSIAAWRTKWLIE